MAFSLDRLYHPLTARPFKFDKNYIEIAPCDALKPYICCFWGAKSNAVPDASEQSQSTLVIPDTCMDIIFNVNYTKEKISAAFCGINDKSFVAYSNNTDDAACTFAIRFYAWSVVLFSDCAVSEALNTYVDAQAYFDTGKRQLERLLLGTKCIEERIKIAEAFLLQRLNASRENANVMNALFWIVKNHGNVTVRDLSAYTHISSRQLAPDLDMAPPYDGAKPYFLIHDIDNKDFLTRLVIETCKSLPVQSRKKHLKSKKD